MLFYALTLVIVTVTGQHSFEAHRTFDNLASCAEYADDVKIVLNNSNYVVSVSAKCTERDGTRRKNSKGKGLLR